MEINSISNFISTLFKLLFHFHLELNIYDLFLKFNIKSLHDLMIIIKTIKYKYNLQAINSVLNKFKYQKITLNLEIFNDIIDYDNTYFTSSKYLIYVCIYN